MTLRQRLAARFPVGCRVICLDDSDPVAALMEMKESYRKRGYTKRVKPLLVKGDEYRVSHHEPEAECPLIRVDGRVVWLAPSRFKRVS